uniref:Polyprotein n=1 Tax=Odorous house ant virus 1 TaxID=3231627 RepID=A0AAU8HXH4_9VIRU
MLDRSARPHYRVQPIRYRYSCVAMPAVHSSLSPEPSNPAGALSPGIVESLRSYLISFFTSRGISPARCISLAAQVISLCATLALRGEASASRIKYTTLLVSQIVGLLSSLYDSAGGELDGPTATSLQDALGSVMDTAPIPTQNDASQDLGVHLAALNALRTPGLARDYVRRHQLEDRVRLPPATFAEVRDGNPVHFAWVFRQYTDCFLGSWFGCGVHRVAHLRRTTPAFEQQSGIPPESFSAVQRLILTTLSFLVTLISAKVSGDAITRRDLIDSLILGRELNALSGDAAADLLPSLIDREPDKRFNDAVRDYTVSLNRFLETPAHQFVRNQRRLYDVATELDQVAAFMRQVPHTKKDAVFPLVSLHNAASIRKNELLASEMPKFKRQEPFVVLVQGPGGIGKTQFVQHLIRRAVRGLLNDGDPSRDVIEINYNDKYWPPLSGQRIAFFDEAGTNQNLKEDLLFANIKSLCSPAYFNCAAADIPHKIAPCTFELIFATTNTDLFKLQSRISSTFSVESVYPAWRRCLVVSADWNSPVVGPYRHDGTGNYKADFTHLDLKWMRWSDETGRLEPDGGANEESLFSEIQRRYRRMESEHARIISEFARESTVQHYSIHLRGPGGHGKTPMAVELASDFARMHHRPLISVARSQDIASLQPTAVPRTVLLDDVCTQASDPGDSILELYNSKLAPGSVLIYCSNINPPRSLVPKITPSGLLWPRSHPYRNVGSSRRLGLSGHFDDGPTPAYNDEYFVENGKAFPVADPTLPWMSCLLSAIPLLAVFTPLWPLAVLAFVLAWWLRTPEHLPDPVELRARSYARFGDFQRMRSEIPTLVGVPPADVTYEFELAVRDPTRMAFPASAAGYERRLFLDRQLFDEDSGAWGMYMTPHVAALVKTNYTRFYLSPLDLTPEFLASEIRRYVRLLREYGLDIPIRVRIGAQTYAYVHGQIYVPAEADEASVPVYHSPTAVHVSSAEGYVEIPLVEIFGGADVATKYSLDFGGAVALQNYTTSPAFMRDPLVCKAREDYIHAWHAAALASLVGAARDKFTSFASSPGGKALLIGFSLLVAARLVWSFIPSMFTSEKGGKGKRKRPPPRYDSDGEDTKSPPKPPARTMHNLVSERQGRTRQDVMHLTDMNDHDAYKKYFENAFRRARRALGMVYIVPGDADVLRTEPAGNQGCYCLFVGGDVFVTVGHIADGVRQAPGCSLYVGHDEVSGFVKCQLIRTYKSRDLSVWRAPGIRASSGQPLVFKNLTGLFVPKKAMYETDTANAVLQRFAPGKVEQYIQGSMEFIEPFYYLDDDGIQEFGYVDFSTWDIMLTYYGDCGLPYYSAEKDRFHDKILGIHCMGNVEGYSSAGISALIYKEDVEEWLAGSTAQSLCSFCEQTDLVLLPASVPKCSQHEIVWSPTHEASPATFYEELRFFAGIRTNFAGMVIKNVGPIAMGSQEHSHTQFLHGEKRLDTPTKGWETTTAAACGFSSSRFPPEATVHRRTIDALYGALFNSLSPIQGQPNWRIHASVYVHDGTRRANITLYIFNQSQPPQPVPFKYEAATDLLALQLPGDIVANVSGDVYDIVRSAQQRLSRGALPYLRIEDVPENDTMEIIGTLPGRPSLNQGGGFLPCPFKISTRNMLPETKYPVRFDVENAPPSVLPLLARDRSGAPSQLATQAIQWAHARTCPPYDLRKYCRDQFLGDILQHYAGMQPLTEHQVLRGFPPGHRFFGYLRGLEIDSSIGWTMKQVFCVTKKDDVLTLSESGEYSWRDNEAAEYQQMLYADSCELALTGRRYWSVFNELLKNEKLKPEKVFIPRTFVAEDLTGILVTRKFLGEFLARSMKCDPTCGIGSNPHLDFDSLYRRTRQHPNMFTGDFKRFDRLLPLSAIEDVRGLLCEANPHMAGPIASIFDTLFHRVQVSGDGIFMVHGGMPSGCLLTAPLNSKINDYMVFTCYVDLCWRYRAAELSTLFAFRRNVEVLAYGDDLRVTVSDAVAEFFNLKTLAEAMLRNFGMVLTSSTKDGRILTFETEEEATWISRTFRKLEKRNFYVGALKKISIQTHLHYATAITPSHLGSLFTTMQFEAAMWDRVYFERVQAALRVAVEEQPKIANHFQFRSYHDIQDEVYRNAYASGVVANVGEDVIPPEILEESLDWFDECEANPDETVTSSTAQEQPKPESRAPSRLSSDPRRKYHRYLARLAKMGNTLPNPEEPWERHTSKAVYLNELFQKGVITKPDFAYAENTKGWHCSCVFTVHDGDRFISAAGAGPSKAVARELAAEDALIQARLPTFKGERQSRFVRQMNVSRGAEHAAPGAPMIQTDPSVAADTGLYTNTQTASPIRVLNPVAAALDNPSGTGAAFDKRDSLYRIYVRWTEKSTTINGSLTTGTEILRISLDPNQLPQRIREWALFHKSCLMQLQVRIVIGGAAGSIGWTRLGWIPDASKSYSLDDLALVASEDLNMNMTLTTEFILNDNRRSGLYRLTQDDPEPWPGMSLVVLHPPTNVQRNNDVDYPVYVDVRLGPDCLFMEPYNYITDQSTVSRRIDVGAILGGRPADLLLGSSYLLDELVDLEDYPECGYLTGNFQPQLNGSNFYCALMRVGETVILRGDPGNPPKTVTLSGINDTWLPHACRPAEIIMAYGKVPKTTVKGYLVGGTWPRWSGYSVYTIPEYNAEFEGIPFNCVELHAFEQGCLLRFKFNGDELVGTQNGGKNNVWDLVKKSPNTYDTSFILARGFQTPSWPVSDPGGPPVADGFFQQRTNQPLTYDLQATRTTAVYVNTSEPPTWAGRLVLNNGRPTDRFYQFTFLQTGNNAPATILPVGLKSCAMVRSGTNTTVTDDSPFVPIPAPGFTQVLSQLSSIQETLNATALTFEVIAGGVRLTQLGFAEGSLLCRTNLVRYIRPALPVSIVFDQIRPTDNLQGLELIPDRGFAPWQRASKLSRRRFVRQSYLLGAGAGIFQGLLNAYQWNDYQSWQDRRQESSNAIREKLARLNNESKAFLQQKDFENHLALLGASSHGAQSGRLGGSSALTDSSIRQLASPRAAPPGDAEIGAQETDAFLSKKALDSDSDTSLPPYSQSSHPYDSPEDDLEVHEAFNPHVRRSYDTAGEPSGRSVYFERAGPGRDPIPRGASRDNYALPERRTAERLIDFGPGPAQGPAARRGPPPDRAAPLVRMDHNYAVQNRAFEEGRYIPQN